MKAKKGHHTFFLSFNENRSDVDIWPTSLTNHRALYLHIKLRTILGGASPWFNLHPHHHHLFLLMALWMSLIGGELIVTQIADDTTLLLKNEMQNVKEFSKSGLYNVTIKMYCHM